MTPTPIHTVSRVPCCTGRTARISVSSEEGRDARPFPARLAALPPPRPDRIRGGRDRRRQHRNRTELLEPRRPAPPLSDRGRSSVTRSKPFAAPRTSHPTTRGGRSQATTEATHSEDGGDDLVVGAQPGGPRSASRASASGTGSGFRSARMRGRYATAWAVCGTGIGSESTTADDWIQVSSAVTWRSTSPRSSWPRPASVSTRSHSAGYSAAGPAEVRRACAAHASVSSAPGWWSVMCHRNIRSTGVGRRSCPVPIRPPMPSNGTVRPIAQIAAALAMNTS